MDAAEEWAMDQFELQKWLERGKLNEATLVLEKELGKLPNSPIT